MNEDETIQLGLEIDTSAMTAALDDLEKRSRSFGSALGSALKAAVVDGKSLESVFVSLGSRLAGLALDAGLKPLEDLLSKSLSNLTGSLSGLFGGGSGLSAPSVRPFADGGIVASPTYFPMDGNFGLMGEAGAEAILPLRRGPDGSLGVGAATGHGPATQITFHVQATDAASFKKSEGQIQAMLTRAVGRGQRGT
jgi:phage-related minor tail protein